MKRTKFKLISKKMLTHDVFELTFKANESEESEAGQFVTFTLFSEEWKKIKRAYSIAYQENETLTFIIKRLENGKWWSKAICDLEEWTEIDGMFPLWIFTLKKEKQSKLFIGTGTWFAPLYFQIKKALEAWIKEKMHFIFGVRHKEDVFYKNELDSIIEKNSNFSYEIYLSRDESEWFKKWYVTDFLTEENTEDYNEFYICGSPAMVTDSQNKLNSLGKINVFSEEY